MCGNSKNAGAWGGLNVGNGVFHFCVRMSASLFDESARVSCVLMTVLDAVCGVVNQSQSPDRSHVRSPLLY